MPAALQGDPGQAPGAGVGTTCPKGGSPGSRTWWSTGKEAAPRGQFPPSALVALGGWGPPALHPLSHPSRGCRGRWGRCRTRRCLQCARRAPGTRGGGGKSRLVVPSPVIVFPSLAKPSVRLSPPTPDPVPGVGPPEMEKMRLLMVWSSARRWQGRHLDASSRWWQVTENEFTGPGADKKDVYGCSGVVWRSGRARSRGSMNGSGRLLSQLLSRRSCTSASFSPLLTPQPPAPPRGPS